MKIHRILIVALALSCGEERATGPELQTTQEDALRRSRVMPAATPYSSWLDRPFYTSDVHRAFTIFTASPPEPDRGGPLYKAYGVDVRRRQVIFQVNLNDGSELQEMSARITNEFYRYSIESGDPTKPYDHGGTFDIVQPPPPPPDGPNGDGWLAARIVSLAANSSHLDKQFFNAGP